MDQNQHLVSDVPEEPLPWTSSAIAPLSKHSRNFENDRFRNGQCRLLDLLALQCKTNKGMPGKHC